MAQTGYTPIQLYYSTTTGNIPSASNLALGEIALNVADAKLFYKTSGGSVQVLAASDVELKVYNNTGSTITQGAAVYLSGGASGQTPYISLAIATSQAASNVIGLTTTSITTGSAGYVTTIGLSSTLNTSAFTAGDTLYLSASSAGTLTTTAPSSPNYAVRIGFVAYANASGYVFIAKTNAYTTASSLVGTVSTTNGGTGQASWTAGQIPYYASGTALNQLTIGTNGQIMTSTGSAPQWSTNLTTAQGGTGLTSFTAGDLPYYATGTALSKLGIGTAGQVLTSSGTAPQWTSFSSIGVSTISFGSTGLTPNTATSGAVTVAGTLATANGGTNLTTFTAANNAIYSTSSTVLTAGTLPLLAGGTGATTVSAAQTNLQVDPAGTAIAMAIALG